MHEEGGSDLPLEAKSCNLALVQSLHLQFLIFRIHKIILHLLNASTKY